MFLLLVIYCCNKASNQIVPKQKELVSSGYPSHQKGVDICPYTHAHQHTQTSRTFCVFAVPRGGYTPSLVENLMSHGRRNESQFWIVSSRLHPYSGFPKHSRKSHTVQCEPNPGRSPHTRISDLHLQQKEIDK